MSSGPTGIDSAIAQQRAAVLRRQRDALVALLRHVWRKSRFYRDLYSAAGISEKDLPAVKLEDLSTVGKKLLMAHFDREVTDQRLTKNGLERWFSEVGNPRLNYLGDFVVCHSSGSSGVQGYSVCTVRDWQLASSVMADRLPAPINYCRGKTKVAFYVIADANHSAVPGALRMPSISMRR